MQSHRESKMMVFVFGQWLPIVHEGKEEGQTSETGILGQ